MRVCVCVCVCVHEKNCIIICECNNNKPSILDGLYNLFMVCWGMVYYCIPTLPTDIIYVYASRYAVRLNVLIRSTAWNIADFMSLPPNGKIVPHTEGEFSFKF